MAKIFPFQPFRYTPSAGNIQDLVTQPYDKIYPAMQQRYLAASPYNLVRVILGEKFPDDTETNNVYTRAAGYFNQWIEGGQLAQDAEPAFYAYFQEFSVPDTGERMVRKGFIGLGEVVEYAAGVVHRHEQTLSGPKKDRREVLRHTHAHFGQIFMLYPDREGAIDRLLDEVSQAEPDMQIRDEYDAVHRLWRIADPALTARVQALMSDKKLLIADGHHRYETALGWRKDNPEMPGADKVMMTFVNMYSPGLKILATHRLVKDLEGFDADVFLAKAGAAFTVSKLASLEELKALWSAPHEGKMRIGCAIAGRDGLYLLETEKPAGRLDVTVLHETLLDKMLGVSAEAVREEKFLKYARGADTAEAQVRGGAAQIGFLLEPTSIEEVADISFGGGVMPQKSTDFYPKLLTGVAIYKLG
jgi:uncharacterized protein (DUF1015 family)